MRNLHLLLSAMICATAALSVDAEARAETKAKAEAKAKVEVEAKVIVGATADRSGASTRRLCALMTGFTLDGITGNPASESGNAAASRKKPALAAALSAAVPGAGEIYAGSWIKAAAFLAIEAAAWVGYSHYTSEGDRMRIQFRAYADQYWNYEKWESEYNPNTDPGSHGLPMEGNRVIKTQQYYEMIGKYDQFMMGWQDWVRGGPDVTERRNAYETMRHDHNHQLINASRCTMVVLTNHLLSTVDAAWTVHRRNTKVRAAMGMEVRMARNEAVPVLSLSVAW